MAVLWTAGTPPTPAEVQAALPRGPARTTVTTTLTRLREKGIAGRRRQGRGYAYYPVQDAPGLTALRTHSELERDADRETVLPRFVARLGPDDERLLRGLLEQEDR
ncbi:BlaI/MecI/CopY family transcriptional regulator [Streptomyces abikoensis]|uniref:BlaI/MecI/CopY family transcriptional regulator n=1 Tax=Streptomyces abikoensis TaxID=97398 RepID=UPI0033CC9B7E